MQQRKHCCTYRCPQMFWYRIGWLTRPSLLRIFPVLALKVFCPWSSLHPRSRTTGHPMNQTSDYVHHLLLPALSYYTMSPPVSKGRNGAKVCSGGWVVQACTRRLEDVLTREDDFWRSVGKLEMVHAFIHSTEVQCYGWLFSGWVLGIERKKT